MTNSHTIPGTAATGIGRWQSVAAVLALAATVMAVLYFSAGYPTPWGTDEIVYSWPIAEAMAEASVTGMLKLSAASFMAEDHLSPVFHFYTYLLTLFGGTPHATINIATRVEYVAILISAVAAYGALTDKSSKTFLFAILLVMNVPLLWTNALFPTFNLSIVLSLWTMVALVRCLNAQTALRLTILGFLAGLTVLSFETGLSFLAFAAGFVTMHYMGQPGPDFGRRAVAVLRIGLVLALSLAPYLVLHAWQYGTPLPGARDGEMADLGQYVLRAFTVFSEWNFGLFKLAYHASPYAAVGLGLAFALLGLAALKARLFTGRAVPLAAGLVLQLAVIAYTGRIQSGMWSFAGIIYVMIMADVMAAALDRWPIVRPITAQVLLIAALGGLFLTSKDYVFKDAEWYNHKRFLDQTAAYQATGGPADDFILIQLPGARVDLHPVAFWYGNKVYNGESPLAYYEDINTMFYKNMFIQRFSNTDGRPFTFFERAFAPSAAKRSVVLSRDSNLFTRHFLDLNDTRVTRAVIIPYAMRDSFAILLPAMEKYGGDTAVDVTLSFTGAAPAPENAAAKIDGEVVEAAATGPGQLEFTLPRPKVRNVLTLASGADRLQRIEVTRRAGPVNRTTDGDSGRLRLAAQGSACRFVAQSAAQPELFTISGTLEAGSGKDLDMLFFTPEAFPLLLRHAPVSTDRSDTTIWRSFELSFDAARAQVLDLCRN